MELLGAIRGLEAVKRLDLMDRIELVSDSQYTLGMANGEYMIHEGRNEDLILPLRKLMKELGATTRWVRGHVGDTLNERCDSLAKRGKREATCPPKPST
jgi:ribonuclease HI